MKILLDEYRPRIDSEFTILQERCSIPESIRPSNTGAGINQTIKLLDAILAFQGDPFDHDRRKRKSHFSTLSPKRVATLRPHSFVPQDRL